MEITDQLVKEHGLTEDEYEKLKKLMGRTPTYVELGVFSVMWSEHCSYKSSRMHLSTFPTTGPQVVQGPGENAGIVDIGDGDCVVFKMESHNHPSFIEPYQGAATGVGGIMRDVFTMGARPVASLNSLRFGSVENSKTPYLVDGVVAGIAGYGNCMGVPTIGGEVFFNSSYDGNCLVNAMNVGLVKKNKIFLGYAEGLGNPVMYVGSKTGRDGIHGATMASDVFGEGSEENRPTVQVGDPFTEKLLLEACMEVFKTDYVVGIQDMGAAGLTSSSVEMADRAGSGIEIDVLKVPRREEGMTPYEVLLSESQERMLIVARKGVEQKVIDIFEKWDLSASVIGTVTDSGRIVITEGGEVVADMPVDALTNAAPQYDRPSSKPDYLKEVTKLDLGTIKEPSDYNETLKNLLGSPNIASRRWIYDQYDHMVRTDTIVRPGSDAGVIRLKGTNKALAMSVDCNSRYCYLDPYEGGKIAVAEAARNVAVSGAKPLASTDCLNFGSPEREDVMWQFKESIKGASEACKALNTPIIGGNVSFYNETNGVAIYPTPTIGMVGLIEDAKNITTQYFKSSGDIIAIIGNYSDNKDFLGGSEYLSFVHGIDGGPCPTLDLDVEKGLQDSILETIGDGLVKSAHDISEGGVAVSMAECLFGPEECFGADIVIDIPEGVRTDEALFGEAQSRVIISFDSSNEEALKNIFSSHNTGFFVVGKVTDSVLKINDIIDVDAREIHEPWHNGFEAIL